MNTLGKCVGADFENTEDGGEVGMSCFSRLMASFL